MIVFLSSTCYDLKDARAEVEEFLKQKGHTALLSDRAGFPVNPGRHRHDVCIDNIKQCDLYIVVIDSRYGADYYKDKNISITWAEFREAIRQKKLIMAFVRKEIFTERLTFRNTKKKFIEDLKKYKVNESSLSSTEIERLSEMLRPHLVDNPKTFKLIDEIQAAGQGIWIQDFDNSTQIKAHLKNMYETEHSLLNISKPGLQASSGEVPLSALSGSSATFIAGNFEISGSKTLSEEVIRTAISKIPGPLDKYRNVLGSGSVPQASNGLFYFVPLDNSGVKEDEKLGIAPTALGRSVRGELEGLVEKMQDQKAAVTRFVDTVKRNPIFCKSFEWKEKAYIVGTYEKKEFHGTTQHFCVLDQFAFKWRVLIDRQLDEEPRSSRLGDNYQLIVHNDELYFYFERMLQQIGTMFQGMGIAEFAILDFKNKSISRLLCSGQYREGGIEGTFKFDLAPGSENAKHYEMLLEREASKSPFIYRTPSDYDINDPKNFIEKWIIENPDFYRNEIGKVTILTYDVNILWDFDTYGSLEGYKNEFDHVENDNYVVFYYFAGPILALRKSDNKYLVILVPQGYGAGGTWGLRSINSVSFVETTLLFAKNDYESYEIDLQACEYKRNYFGAALSN